MRLVLTLAFVLALAASIILTALMRGVAKRIGFVDMPGGRKQHPAPMPRGGGVSIVLASCLIIFGAAVVAHALLRDPTLWPVPAGLTEDVALAADKLHFLLYILGGGLAVAFLGLWDDIHPFRPVTKLICQFIIVSIIVVTSGMRITLFIPGDFAQAAVTIVWIVLLTNSFNLLDNMDGLSGTVAFICAAALLILALQTTQFFIAGFVLALMGAVLGFLLFNFPPASIFMGDTGSMFVGYMLATAAVLTTFVTREQAHPLFPVAVPLLLFAVPLYDTASVLVIRFRAGKPLLVGDRNHFSHRLLRLGMSTRRVLLTVGLVTAATALGATVPYGSSVWRVAVPVVQALCVLAVVMLLEVVSGQSREP